MPWTVLPGVHSARYAGPDGDSAANVAKLLDALADVDDPDRTARFRTVALVAWPDGSETVGTGVVEGHIARVARGDGGFGYDPVFVPVDADGRTFAEMSDRDKNADQPPWPGVSGARRRRPPALNAGGCVAHRATRPPRPRRCGRRRTPRPSPAPRGGRPPHRRSRRRRSGAP